MSKFSVSRQAFDRAVNRGLLLTSDETLLELSEVIFRSKFTKYSSVEARELFYLSFIEQATNIPVELILNDCRDPKDNKFLELAVAGNADVLVTGDKDLLILHPYQGTLIMNSSDFLAWVEQNG